MTATKISTKFSMAFGDRSVLANASPERERFFPLPDPRPPDQQIADGLFIIQLADLIAVRDDEKRRLYRRVWRLEDEADSHRREKLAQIIAIVFLLCVVVVLMWKLCEMAPRTWL